MKKSIFTLTFLLEAIFSQAQKSFIRIYKLPDLGIEARSVQITNDGGYMMVGTSMNYTANYKSKGVLIKTNSFGEIDWTKTFGDDDNYAQINCIEPTNDGGYILGGLFKQSGQIVKLDQNGTPEFTRTFGPFNAPIGAVKQTSDGGYIVTGPPMFNGSTTGDHSYLVKFNSTGQITWSKEFQSMNIDLSNDVQQTKDGGFVMVGTTGGKYPSQSGIGRDIVVIKTNSQGDTLWCKSYGTELPYEEGYSIQETVDGGFIVGANSQYGDAYIFKLNSIGTIAWARFINDINVFSRIKQTKDGGYFAIGSKWQNNVALVKLTSTGNRSWAKNIEFLNRTVPYNFQQTSDSGFVIVGETDTTQGAKQHTYRMFMAKTDSIRSVCSSTINDEEIVNLELTTKSYAPVIYSSTITATIANTMVGTLDISGDLACAPVMGTNDKYNITSQLEIHPNPFTLNTRLQWSSNVTNAMLSIYNQQGNLVRQIENLSGSEIEINRENLLAGIYFIKISENGTTVLTHKLVVID